MGSTTTQDRPGTRAIAPGHVAFRFDDSVGALIAIFRSSIPSPSIPLFTLHRAPRDAPVQNSGPSGSLLLSRKALSSSTPCRFIPAHHHIFFPPRLEVVVEQQNTDGLPSHTRNQSPLNGFLGYQAHGPTGAALGGSLHTMAIIRCFWLSSSTAAAPGRCFSIQRGFQTARW